MSKLKLYVKSSVFVFLSYPFSTSLVVVLSIAEGLIPASLALIMKNLVDSILVPERIELNTFFKLVLIWIFVMILSQAVSSLLRLCIDIYKVRLANNLSEKIIERRLNFFGIALFENEDFVKVYERLSKTHIAIENFINNSRYLFKSIIQFISLFIIFTQFELWVALLVFISIIPSFFTSKKISKIQLDEEELYYDNERIVSYYRDALIAPSNAREMRIFSFETLFLTKFKNYCKIFFKQNKKLRIKIALYDFTAVLFRIICTGMLMYILSKQAIAGKITAGLFAMFLQSVFLFSTAMAELIETWAYFDWVIEYFKKLFDFFQMQDTLQISKNTKTLNGSIKTIEFCNVSFSYDGKKNVLENLSFTIYANEITALVGENGAGKTTIIKLIARFYDPTNGVILVNGINIKDLDINEYQNKISAVFQDYAKYNLTVHENIFADNQFDNAISEKVDLGFCKDLKDGFNTKLGTYLGGVELSGGQWQRIAIARGLAKKHDLLLVDEATASIDPIQERSIYESLLEKNKTILLVTHRLGSIRRADTILVLQNGKLIARASHDELMMNCLYYKELYSSQADMYK